MLRAVLYACVGAAVIAGGARADSDTDVQTRATVEVQEPEAPTVEVEEPEPEPEPAESISCGCTNRGAIFGAAALDPQGTFHTIPEPWASRGYHYGTTELVEAIERAAAAVAVSYPGSILGVADLSADGGGSLPGHRSHQSGRDADLLFYALDPAGAPMAPDSHMPVYTRSGKAYYARAPEWNRNIPERYFDLARNWAFVRALLTDPTIEVDRIFVSRRIRRWLLDYAEERGEPDDLRQRAAVALRRPSKGQAHDDHMHLRIKCSADDIDAGRCRDEPAPSRKRKYRSRIRCPR